MNSFRYIIQSFLHYFRLNIAVILGVALSTAILLGAFIIGDSVRYNLQKITLDRLGKTDYIITAGERIFRSDLSDKLNENGLNTTSILSANGMAILNGGEARVNQLQVWGIDQEFNYFAKTDSLYTLQRNEAIINLHLADILGVKTGQELLIRINKLSTFPSNTPFVSAEENSISFRVKIKAIATVEQTGNFNLQNIQSSPKNIFLAKKWLNQQLDLNEKANLILASSDNTDEDQLKARLQKYWQLEDINLKIRKDEKLGFSEIISDRVFIEPEIEEFAINEFKNSYPVFTYFVNQFELNEKATPYSFVAGVPSEIIDLEYNEIIINRWMANDLDAKPGDTIKLSYFEVGPLRKLVENKTHFIIKNIVEIDDKWDDQLLMPEIPGMFDAGHCRDWETGVPVDLSSIRQKDEDYWNLHKGTPKAFIKLDAAKKLWKNRFGESTAIRFNTLESNSIRKQLLAGLSPTSVGFQITSAKDEGLTAASGGVDFGELFIGLSFFVLFAALLLAYLMFRLYLNYRETEVRTLQAIGFPAAKIRKFILTESIFIIVSGILIGIPIGLVYNDLIIRAINTIWFEIVQAAIVETQITFSAIVKAFSTIAFISILAVWFILKKLTKHSVKDTKVITRKRVLANFITGLVLLMGSIAILVQLLSGSNDVDPNLFFAAGFGLLPAFILLLNSFFLLRSSTSGKLHSFRQLIFNRLYNNRKKAILLISFLSVGIFLVLSTGLNRKDLTKNADLPSSGTGGYDYFAETSLPVLIDLNSEEGQFEFGLENEIDVVQFRALQGDDASCLNLNRVSRPRLLGFDPLAFDKKQAFTFTARTNELDTSTPWLSLNETSGDNLIPAIADQTVIKWGLGKSVGDTLIYKNEAGEEISLKLIGGLANSIFQGNILISEKQFLKHFPSVSGCQVFLISGKDSEETLKSAMRNYGLEITPAKDRLLKFYQVENTYLNIFLQLGALGLLIGTIGLGVIIFRSLLEQRSELAVLQANGFTKMRLFKMILSEHLLMVVFAVIISSIPAIISAIPSLTSELYNNLIYWAVSLVLIVLFSASIWIYIAGKLTMKSELNEALRNY